MSTTNISGSGSTYSILFAGKHADLGSRSQGETGIPKRAVAMFFFHGNGEHWLIQSGFETEVSYQPQILLLYCSGSPSRAVLPLGDIWQCGETF